MGSFYSTSYKNIDHDEKGYGFLPDFYNINDKKYRLSGQEISKMKKNINLSEYFPEAYDQKGFNSSTANAIASVIEFYFNYNPDHERKIDHVSRMFIYNLGRKAIHQYENNSPTSIRETLKFINRYGIIEEKKFPYDNISFETKIPEKGSYRGYFKYYKVHTHDINDFKTILSVKKLPIIFGMNIYESFNNSMLWDNDGTMPMPKLGEKLIGMQTLVAIGYSNKRESFLVRNSWGKNWKSDGNFYVPFDYFKSKNCDNYYVLKIDFDLDKDEFETSDHEEKKKKYKRSRKKNKKEKREKKENKKEKNKEEDSEEEEEPEEIKIRLNSEFKIKDLN